MIENAVHGIFDHTHDKAVKQRYMALHAGSSLNASAGKELETFQGVMKSLLPSRLIFRFDTRESLRDPAPRILNGALVLRGTSAIAVLCIPDVPGNISGEVLRTQVR
jgi:hypothetical protein